MQTIKDVEKWLEKHGIKSYSISGNLHVNVNENVDLKNKIEEDFLPVKFEKINGYFDISDNNLISLEGCPKEVQKDFDCSNNNLTSLFGAPQSVGDFDCSNNSISSLSYSPKEIDGFFNCSNNNLISIEGSPRTIKGYFKCSNNSLTSLKGSPKYILQYFDCSDNKIDSLKNGPMSVTQDYVCFNNELKSLENIADEIGWDVITDINLNHIPSSLFDEEKKFWRYKGNEVIKHIYKPVVAFEKKEDIVRWLNKEGIKSFKVLKDNSVDVVGDVKLSSRLNNYQQIPINFNKVDGNFDVSDNVLISLEGSPKKVSGDFLAYKNELTSLKGAPKEVGKNFVILKNNIRSLTYSPSHVGEDFICSHNPLSNLEGLVSVGGSIFTSVLIPSLKHSKFSYHSVLTYKYQGSILMEYLEKEYITLTEEELIFAKTRTNLENAIKKMINENALKKEMINDTLLKNLTKYNLIELKKIVMLIKEPKEIDNKKELSEEEILQSVFDMEI